MEMAERVDLGLVTNTLQLPPSAAFDGLREAIEKAPFDVTQTSDGETHNPTLGAMSGLAETLAVIEYRIAEVFAQLTGDAPL